MSALGTVLEWRPRTPFFYGWLILGVAALGAFVSTTIAGVVLGGIQSFIFEDTGWSRTSIGLTASVGVWLSGLSAPIAGRLADRYGPRWLMPLGTLGLGVCLFSLGGVTSVWQFFLAATLARAISQPVLIGVVPRTLAVNFFRRQRNVALALTGMFRPISGAIIIQIVSLVAVTYGWRTAFRYFGVMSLLLTIPMALIVRKRPEDIGLLPDGAGPRLGGGVRSGGRLTRGSAAAGTRATAAAAATPEVSWTAGAALRNRAFWMVAGATFLVVTGGSSIGFNMVPYLHEEAGISTPQAVGVLSLSTFLALGSLAWGYLAGKFSPRWCMVGSMVVGAGVIGYLSLVDSLLSAYVFGVVWGLTSSALEVLVYMLLANYFGRDSYGSIAGALRPFEAGALGLGQSLGAVIHDFSGSYQGVLVVSICSYLAAALLVFLARAPVPTPERGG